ncbi:glutamate-cysteine ligase [Microsporum canis CBS 113480]|uniref:Glutamate--cysteine ligase n=1 Tax=Arthroderma otae (strain ATCC MYA-4605 / CBS 113480) TaxID=554155 RepID=C5FV58_ARTOC|nr:glutamate-cysteine ligase [Microsporum canis CBS 113480]EEQ33792.1 glutamate-cysteine ligase [Microsporum canis CBS 113480]
MARSKEESRSSEGMGYRGIAVLFASASGLRLLEARSPCGLGLMLYLFSNSNYSPYGRKRGERSGTPSSGATRTKYSSLNYYYKVEYLVVAVDDKEEKVRLSLCQAEILKALAQDAELSKQAAANGNASEEYSLSLKRNRKSSRVTAKNHMAANEYPITLTTFPRLGCSDDFTSPTYSLSGPALRSQFVPDEIANPHIRFPTLAANIRSRRGRKVELNVPVFRDTNTPWPFKDPTVNYDLHNWPEDDDVRNGAAKEGHVYMDAMAFGMGSCCLQITFQSKNITEGRKLYDQLSPLGPILLALTGATPIYKGFLVDTDVRWNQIGNAVDCRTREELGEVPLKNDRWRIPKSRYASNSTYISQDPHLRPEYMDPDLVIDEDIKKKLMDGGMDDLLATHFAHLFIRDPIVIFNEDLQELDLTKTDHFENLQSTNWQHIRFKPPPADNDIGWRVEFRPMEIQITDFENAAFSIFMVLITRAILSFDLNFYIPIPKTTENMETAHARNAVLDKKFYFRKDPFPHRFPRSQRYQSRPSSPPNSNPPSPPPSTTPSSPLLLPIESEYTLMSVNDIINGSSDGFPGLIPLVESYLDSLNVDVETRCALAKYLDLIRCRADGSLWTNAKWIREFVAKHPDYKHDSVVSAKISYDLVKAVEEITEKEGKDGSIGWEMFTAKKH